MVREATRRAREGARGSELEVEAVEEQEEEEEEEEEEGC